MTFEHLQTPALLLALLLPWTALADDRSGSHAANAEAEADTSDTRPRTTHIVHDEVLVNEELPARSGSSTIGARLPLALRETPISVSTVSAALIEDQDADVLGDALRNTSGVNVQSGNGIFDVFTLRGLDSSANGLILTDGVPEPQTAFFHLYNVERVEVLRGPSSFLFGRHSMAGAVNLVRKLPSAENAIRFTGSAGSFATREGRVDANYAGSESWGMRLNSMWRRSELYRDDKQAEVFAVNPSFAWRLSERLLVHLSLERVEIEASPDAGLPLLWTGAVADVPRTRSYQSPFDISTQDTSRFQLDIEARIADNLVVRNKTWYRGFDWLSKTTILNGAFPDSSGSVAVSRSLLLLDDHQDFMGNQFEVLWQPGSGSRHNLLFGLDVARLADRFLFDVGQLPAIDLFNPVETAQVISPIPSQSFGTDARSTVVAPYFVDQIRFSDAWQALLGLRFDSIDFEDDSTAFTRDDSRLSPTLGLMFRPNSRVSLWATVGEAFSPASTFAVGEDREPEESRQLELGSRLVSTSGNYEAALALFTLERENIAIPDQTGVTQQTGVQENEGVELELDFTPWPHLRGTLTYTWTKAELTEFAESIFDPTTFTFVTLDRSGNAPPFTPKHVVNLWLGTEFDNGLGFGAGGHYVSEQFIAADGGFAIDAYTTVDAMVFYDHRPWRLQLNLKNLTGEATFTRVFGGNSVVPAPGFTATVGLRYRI